MGRRRLYQLVQRIILLRTIARLSRVFSASSFSCFQTPASHPYELEREKRKSEFSSVRRRPPVATRGKNAGDSGIKEGITEKGEREEEEVPGHGKLPLIIAISMLISGLA